MEDWAVTVAACLADAEARLRAAQARGDGAEVFIQRTRLATLERTAKELLNGAQSRPKVEPEQNNRWVVDNNR